VGASNHRDAELPAMLTLKGVVMSIDAMDIQRAIAKQIIDHAR
jgi:hypothetical protein